MVDVDPMEAVEDAQDESDSPEQTRKNRLNAMVAVTVAIVATFLGICEVKDDNINQGMQRAQANRVDDWSWYQARHIREQIMEAQVDQLEAARDATKDADAKAIYQARADVWAKLAKEQADKKAELKKQADQDQVDYDELNYRDDQFDLCSAMIAIAISLMAITSLTQKRWLFWLAMAPTLLGILMGLAGLLEWKMHSELLARILS